MIPPDADSVARVTRLSRLLRDRGIPTTTTATIDAARALGIIDAQDRRDVHLALRLLFVTHRGDFGAFDDVFDAWWNEGALSGVKSSTPSSRRSPNPSVIGPTDEPRRANAWTALKRWADSLADADSDDTVPLASPSAREATGSKDFRFYTSDDLGALEDVAARIVKRLRTKRSRRWRHARRGGRLDLRRMTRLALATGGDPIRVARRERALRRTKLVVLCDVSGSMDLYSRFLLQVLYALQHAFARVETFAFSTRLVRITDSLSRASYDAALDALAAVADAGWSGGTKIGASIEAVATDWPRIFDRRTAVIILSDGWDTGEPEVLGNALRELSRRAGRIIWLNPLLGNPSYQPLTRGMQAALPYIDVFAPAHDLASLEQLASHLSF